MGFETLLFELRDGIAYVTLNRPQKLNALNQSVLEELGEAFHQIAKEPAVRAAILTGAGEKAFVAGADIQEIARLGPMEAQAMSRRGQQLFDFIENLGKPTIAAVNGYALGGGCELAMAATLRIASEIATFGQPEVKLGIIPGYAGTQRLRRLVGEGRALEMILTGDSINAQEAYRIGLVQRVVPAAELLPTAESLARKIMANAPLAVKLALEAVRRGANLPHAEGENLESALFGLACSTEDMKEGTRAFIEKRAAKFKGE